MIFLINVISCFLDTLDFPIIFRKQNQKRKSKKKQVKKKKRVKKKKKKWKQFAIPNLKILIFKRQVLPEIKL